MAQAYQLAGRLDEAIGPVQQLHGANPGDVAIALSLADLLSADGDYEGVVEVASRVTNTDDISLGLVHMRAAAVVALGHTTAALDAFKDADQGGRTKWASLYQRALPRPAPLGRG